MISSHGVSPSVTTHRKLVSISQILVGASDGAELSVGAIEGTSLGLWLGVVLGAELGAGESDGAPLSTKVGIEDGLTDGSVLGLSEASFDGCDDGP